MGRRADALDGLLEPWRPGVGTPGPGAAVALLEMVEGLLAGGRTDRIPAEHWRRYLDWTRRRPFLSALPDREHRHRWAETTFPLIAHIGYDLRAVMEDRLRAHPERTFFQEFDVAGTQRWSYGQVARRSDLMAAVLLGLVPEGPRVAILAENSVDGACCDLACLLHGLLVAPLSIHLDIDELLPIFERLAIDIVVTDNAERLERLLTLRELVDRPFRIVLVGSGVECGPSGCLSLETELARLDPREAARRLQQRTRPGIDEPATVLFTSGSTGQQKGVVFSQYHLVTKRFARAAALPEVGEEEVILAYLPLFHTFGRFLELQGMLFWGGTYTFTGSGSTDRFLSLLREVRPTGLISIPARWEAIHERCRELFKQQSDPIRQRQIVQGVVGDRLRWGLSAAGYQDPRVFRFFPQYGIELCSGFGMTEGTGGITMTPPGAYEEGTVGIPLPGVRVRFSEEGELQVAGPFIAPYLEGEPGEPVGPLNRTEEVYWLATGDLFRVRPSGYLEIVDRIKDIYKNSRGQTIAPLRVERKFSDVPGIKRTFLVGDGRNFNVLLIVPDPADPVLKAAGGPERIQEYFHQIVAAANRDLAPFERVVNFTVLERDFDPALEELTPKGSYRRKTIAGHFTPAIEHLYERESVDLEVGGLRIHIPRWVYRDLGILEDDIVPTEEGLFNRMAMRLLSLRQLGEPGAVLIGDLEYHLTGEAVDLGLFARQPLLWLGNPALIQFCPCRDGWDLPLHRVSPQVLLPRRQTFDLPVPAMSENLRIQDVRLAGLNRQFVRALFATRELALAALEELGRILGTANPQVGGVIRRRLEALSHHPDLEVRATAYRILLLDEPVQDYSRLFPSFLQAGLPFLTEQSIGEIARFNLEQSRLESLRQRMHNYRAQLPWPTDPTTRRSLMDILALLADFARFHPEYYGVVRAELVSWALHIPDPELAAQAQGHFERLGEEFEDHLERLSPPLRASEWTGRIVFQDGLSAQEIRTLERILVGTTFLKESVMLAFDGETFELAEVPERGIWISRVLSMHPNTLYRVSINNESGHHLDLLLVHRPDLDSRAVTETNYWMIALHGYPWGQPVVPQFGCARPELGAFSLAYVGELTVWERIREYSGWQAEQFTQPAQRIWRTLFVRAMAVFFSGWYNSGRRVVPGAVSPTNVVVPEPDFRQGTVILSLTGWKPYTGPVSLVEPMVYSFYQQTISHYPRTLQKLDLDWIFDACVEALGVEEADDFLTALLHELSPQSFPYRIQEFTEALQIYRERLRGTYHVPLAVQLALERYEDWQGLNPDATPAARQEQVAEVYRLYRIDRLPDLARYWLYRHSYFRDASPGEHAAMDALLHRMFHTPTRRPTQMVELSDFQAVLTDPEDRRVFGSLIFPSAPGRGVEVVTVGEVEHKEVIVRSRLTDKLGEEFTVRSPIEPGEIGRLYRVFIRAGYPIHISELDRFLLVLDAEEQVVGGIRFKLEGDGVVHLDGLVIAAPLRDRGISGALLEDFCVRLQSRGMRVVKTHFHFQHFYLRHGFQVHHRWGGLVRFLTPPEERPGPRPRSD